MCYLLFAIPRHAARRANGSGGAAAEAMAGGFFHTYPFFHDHRPTEPVIVGSPISAEEKMRTKEKTKERQKKSIVPGC